MRSRVRGGLAALEWSAHWAILAVALLPLELVFWIGFSLPFGPIVAVARTVLILMSWTSTSRTQV